MTSAEAAPAGPSAESTSTSPGFRALCSRVEVAMDEAFGSSLAYWPVRRAWHKRIAGVLLAVLVTAFAVYAAGTVALRATGNMLLVIRGGSMEPAVPFGALIVVDERTAPSGYAVGDIATYRLPSSVYVTHRVTEVHLGVEPASFRFKGDANPTPDPLDVPASWLVGRVTMVVPLLGWLVGLAALPSGAVTILALAFALQVHAGGTDRRKKHHPRFRSATA